MDFRCEILNWFPSQESSFLSLSLPRTSSEKNPPKNRLESFRGADGIWHLVFFLHSMYSRKISFWIKAVVRVAVVNSKVWSCKLRLDATWTHNFLLYWSLAPHNRWISIIDFKLIANRREICSKNLRLIDCLIYVLISIAGPSRMLVTEHPWAKFTF